MLSNYFKNPEERARKISQTKRRKIDSGETTFKKGKDSHKYKDGISKWRLDRTRTLEEIAGRLKPSICEVCGAGGKICFDHDHQTGYFRGWICHNCNTALGLVRDRIELLNKLIDYLNKSQLVKLSPEAIKQLNISNKIR